MKNQVGESMDVNFLINIIASLATLDAVACMGYNLYMLKKYSDGACGKFAIDFLPFGMLVKIVVVLLLLLIFYVKYISDHDYFLYWLLLLCGWMAVADMIASRVEFLIDEYK